MDEKECETCSRYTKEKYKHYLSWKITAIVFIFIAVLFVILYFASVKMFVEETVENNIVVENAEGNNENNIITGNGSTISGTVKKESNIGGIIIICVVILSGGIVGGCYIISQKKSDK